MTCTSTSESIHARTSARCTVRRFLFLSFFFLRYRRPPSSTLFPYPPLSRSSHPKLPEYELATAPATPRDPGPSSAYNVGLGLSKIRGPLTFGIAAIYEPIWSYTWADVVSEIGRAHV